MEFGGGVWRKWNEVGGGDASREEENIEGPKVHR